MIDSLYIGATGMHAQQTGVDVVAQNLANMNTCLLYTSDAADE